MTTTLYSFAKPNGEYFHTSDHNVLKNLFPGMGIEKGKKVLLPDGIQYFIKSFGFTIMNTLEKDFQGEIILGQVFPICVECTIHLELV